MRAIPNPAYINAPYQLLFASDTRGLIQDNFAHRFDKPWPDNICEATLFDWVFTHSIPPTIEVE